MTLLKKAKSTATGISPTVGRFDSERLRYRLIRSLGANAYGQLIVLAIQIFSVPLFIAQWGTEKYGEWLLLSTIPTYLALTDFGITAVAGNQMTILFTEGNDYQALRIFRAAWTMTVGLCLVVLLLLFLLSPQIASHLLGGSQNFKQSEIALSLTLLGCVALLAIIDSTFGSLLRAIGKNHVSVAIQNTAKLLEWIAAILALVIDGRLTSICEAMLAVRLIASYLFFRILRTAEPGARPSLELLPKHQTIQMIRAALAYLAFPLGLLFSIQSMLLLVGLKLGPAAATVFATSRTFARFIIQAQTVISQSVWPEMSAAYGAGNFQLLRRLLARTTLTATLLGSGGGMVALITAPTLLEIWTHGKVTYDHILIIALLLVTFINCVWQPSWVLLMATNRHEHFSLHFILAGSAAVAIAAAVPTHHSNLALFAALLFGAELYLSVSAIGQAISIIKNTNKQ